MCNISEVCERFIYNQTFPRIQFENILERLQHTVLLNQTDTQIGETSAPIKSKPYTTYLINLIRHIFFRQGWQLLNPYWRKCCPTKMCLVRYIPKKIRLKLHVTELKNIRVYERRWSLTYFSPILHFYTSGTCHRVKGFLTFSESLEM